MRRLNGRKRFLLRLPITLVRNIASKRLFPHKPVAGSIASKRIPDIGQNPTPCSTMVGWQAKTQSTTQPKTQT